MLRHARIAAALLFVLVLLCVPTPGALALDGSATALSGSHAPAPTVGRAVLGSHETPAATPNPAVPRGRASYPPTLGALTTGSHPSARTSAGPTLTTHIETLDLLNGTVLPGNAWVANGHGPSNPGVYDPATGRFFDFTIWSESLVVVNASQDRDIANIPLNFTAEALAIDPVTDLLYVPNYSGSSVTIVNASSLAIVGTVGVGASPYGVVWDPAANAIVVANSGSNNTTWINGTSRAVFANVAVGNDPESLLYDPLTQDVLVANFRGSDLSVINSTGRNVTATVNVSSYPEVIFQNPVTGTVYVSNFGPGNLTLRNGTSYAAVGSLSGSASNNEVDYDAATGRVYLLLGSTVTGLYASNDTTASTAGVTAWSRSLAVDPATHEVYVSGGVNNSVTVLNGSTGTPVVTVPSFFTPTGVVYNPLRQDVYVTEEGGMNISALNGTTHAVESDILTGASSQWIGGIPGRATVYLGGGCGDGAIIVLDPSTGNLTGCDPSVDGAYASAWDPVDQRLFIADGGSRVYAVNASSGAVSTFLSANWSYDPQFEGIAWSPVNDSLYVVSSTFGNVTVWNSSSGRFLSTVSVGNQPVGALYDPSDGTVWVADWGGTYVSRIYTSNDTPATSISVGTYPYGLALDPDTAQVYVTLNGANEVAVVGAANDTVALRLPVGNYPTTVTVDVADQVVLVANEEGANVTALDALGLRGLGSVATTQDPTGLAYDPADRVLVVSSAGAPVADLIGLNLSAGPEVTEFAATPSNLTFGQTTRLTVDAVRGNGTLSYRYTGLPTGCLSADSPSLNCTPSGVGNFTIGVNVTDRAGASTTAVTRLEVVDHLAIASLSAAPSVLDLGMTLNLTANVAGAPPPYRFNWSNLPNGCVGGNVSTFTCQPTALGTFGVTFSVQDSAGVNRTSSVNVVVDSRPAITSIAATPTAVDLGQSVVVRGTAANGTAPLSPTFSSLPSGCSAPAPGSYSLTCAPSAPGTYSVELTVTDGVDVSVNRSITFVVNPRPTIATFVVSPAPSYVGGSSQITATVGGGIGPYNATFTGLPTGCTPSNALSISCTPTAKGTFTVEIIVTDHTGDRAYGNLSDTVLAAPTSPQITSFAANPDAIEVGNTTYVNVTVVGGTPPLSYTYTELPLGCASADTATLTCVPIAAGTFAITVEVTDAAGRSTSATASLVVSPTGTGHLPATGTVPPPLPWNWVALGIAGGIGAIAGCLAILFGRRLGRKRSDGPTEAGAR